MLLVLSLLGLGGPARAEAPSRTVVILDQVELPPKVEGAHERLRAAVQEAVEAKGWKASSPSVTECRPIDSCLAKLEASGVAYLMTITGKPNQALGFDLSLELQSMQSTRKQGATSLCDYCAFDRLVQNVARAAGELLDKAEAENLALQTELRRPAPATAAPAPLTDTPAAAPRQDTLAALPAVAIGLGTAMVGYGAWALLKDGDRKGCAPLNGVKTCEVYASKLRGATFLSLGTAAILGGVAWKLWGPTPNATVSLSPHQLAFTTRY